MGRTRLNYSAWMYTGLIFLFYNIHANHLIHAIYSSWYGAPLHGLLTSSKWPSVLAGMYANCPISALHIPWFIKQHAIDINEIEKPISSFKTFNEFFIRTLKKEARPLAQEQNGIISPADGTILMLENLSMHSRFPIKGVTFNLEKLLNDKYRAQEFEGGTAIIVRLAPWDYHRLHFPLAGLPEPAISIHGRYESVNPLVYGYGVQPLEINERHLIRYHTDAIGTIALIPVGALFVGGIIHTYRPYRHYNKGDEIGYFTFGGSTIVMLFKANTITVLSRISQNSAAGIETPIKMGQLIAHYTVSHDNAPPA